MPISPLQFEIDKVDRNTWDQLITQFEDASLYQTWSFGALAVKGSRVSNIVIKNKEEILGCCQVSLRRFSLPQVRVADILWGPVCMRKGRIFEPSVLSDLVVEIKKEYGIRRGYLLRIWPHGTGERKELLKQILESEGFKRNPNERPYRTLKLDISPPLDDLRRNFLQKWRNCLNKAERNGLRVVEGTNEDIFGVFVMLGKEMVDRKDLTTRHIAYFEQYRRIQEGLPEKLKMRIMICEADCGPVSGAIFSAIGYTGIYIVGATGRKGLGLNGSYLLQWRMIQWMKENGVRHYDLGGYDPQFNPGVNHFKLGIVGKTGWEETFLGEHYGCFSLSGRITKLLLDCREFIRGIAGKRN